MKYVKVTTPDVNNGNGFRVSLWVSGCRHKCKGCHNEHTTWRYDIGKPLFDSLPEVCTELMKPYIKGITITGGDPLDQDSTSLAELTGYLRGIRNQFPDKDIWLYTGFVFETDILTDYQKMAVVKECDVLVDGPFMIDLLDRSLPFRGSSNQRIIDVKKTLSEGVNVVCKSLSDRST